jgi:hypothetical protein
LSASTNHVTNAEFSLLRLGGCGSGSITLSKEYDYSTIGIGMWIQMSYANTPWYLGRVESIDASHPSGVTVALQGMLGVLSDLPVGDMVSANLSGPRVTTPTPSVPTGLTGDTGYNNIATHTPILLSNNQWYYRHDPNLADQTYEPVSDYEVAVQYIIDNYLAPFGITEGTVSYPTTSIDFYSMLFQGESSVTEVLRVLAESCYNASYGIDGSGQFFFIPLTEGIDDWDELSSTPQETYQLGTNVAQGTSYTQAKSVFYNRVQLVGGYVYGDNATRSGFYRYVAQWQDDTYSDVWGYKAARISVPFIRNDWAAYQWFTQFFKKYAGPRTRYTFTTIGQGSTLVAPWLGRIRLNNAAGTALVTDVCDEIKVLFNNAPYYTITTGPEELQYPEADVEDATHMPSQGSSSSGDNRNLPLYPTGDHPTELPPYFTDECNEEHEFTPEGTITGGELVLTYVLNGVSADVTIQWDSSGFVIEQEFVDQHTEVGIDDISVTGSVVSGFTITWRKGLANKEIDLPTIDFSGLTGATDYTAAKLVTCNTCECYSPSSGTSGVCECVVGVGVHAPDESPPFHWKSCHRFIIRGLGALISDIDGFPTVTDADLAVTRHATDPQWDSATIERTCTGVSPPTTDDYALILTQQTYGWKAHFRCVNGGAVNCADEVDWVFTTPTTL